MDLQYAVTIYMTLFALIIMFMIVWNNDLLDKKKKLQFFEIFGTIIVAAIAEWLGVYLEGAPAQMRVVHILAKTIDHSLAPMIGLLFAQVISSRANKRCLWIPLLIHAVLELASGWLGFIYYIDKNNHYAHGKCYWIYVVIYLFYSIYFLAQAWRFGNKYQNNNKGILGMTLLFFVSGVTLGMVYSQIRVAYICVAIDTIIIYVYYTGIIEKMDSMTGLLNRRSYESRIVNMEEKVQVLFFDVDDFKHINDNFGHQFGDECLRIVGRAIRAVYGANGHCYRIGGDEFCVLLEKKRESIDNLYNQFFRYLDKMREKDKRIPYVSVGDVAFNPKTTDIESAIKEADMKMYERKQQKKQENIYTKNKNDRHTNIG